MGEDDNGQPHTRVGGHFAHAGIVLNARELRRDLEARGHLRRYLSTHPHAGVRVVGHSLGAGTAALLTLFLARSIPERDIRGFCYGSPLLCDRALATRCEPS